MATADFIKRKYAESACRGSSRKGTIGHRLADGYEFIRRVRMLGGGAGKVQAVALTAFARLEDRTAAMLAGYQMHLAKPVDARELIVTVASLARRTKG